MSVTDKIKAILSIKGKKNIELAEYLGISSQSMQNKLSRGSFSAEDLIKIADFLDCTLAFNIDENQKIILERSDIRENNHKSSKAKGVDTSNRYSESIGELKTEPTKQAIVQNDTKQEESPNKHYKQLTDSELSQIDLNRLINDPVYQFDIRDIYGIEQLAKLLEKAREQSASKSEE